MRREENEIEGKRDGDCMLTSFPVSPPPMVLAPSADASLLGTKKYKEFIEPVEVRERERERE